MAPFLDPGSEAFEKPEQFGYKVFYRTLEEHRRALEMPSWKYFLSYETIWMSREEIVESTYEAGLRLNELKKVYGLISQRKAEDVACRIKKARSLIRQIDELLTMSRSDLREKFLSALKPQVDSANTSTVCDKEELNLKLGPLNLRFLRSATILLRGSEL